MSENAIDTSTQSEGDTETPVVPAPVEAVKPVVPQKFKLGEEEYDEETLKGFVKTAKTADQIKREGYKKFEEASAIRKNFRGIQEIVKQDPERGIFELAKILGVPADQVDALFKNRAEAEKQWAEMSPEQKALYMAQQRAQAAEKALADRETQDKAKTDETEYAKKLDEAERLFAKETLPAMQEANLPQNPLTVKMVAATLAALADREGPDSPPDVREAVDYVANAWQADRDAFVKGFTKDPGAFSSRYPDLTKAILKAEVARATGRSPVQTTGTAAAPRAAPTAKASQTWSDFSKQIRALQTGKRL